MSVRGGVGMRPRGDDPAGVCPSPVGSSTLPKIKTNDARALIEIAIGADGLAMLTNNDGTSQRIASAAKQRELFTLLAAARAINLEDVIPGVRLFAALMVLCLKAYRMPDAHIFNRTQTDPPKSPLNAIWNGMESLARRLVALDQREREPDETVQANGPSCAWCSRPPS